MRVLIDIEDDDAARIASARRNKGAVVEIRTPDGPVTAWVIGRAEPLSLAGSGSRYKAFYSITMLEEL